MTRKFEEKCGQLYGQQKIKGFCHLSIGQEACYSGAKTALKDGDHYITSYRDHGPAIAVGSDPKELTKDIFSTHQPFQALAILAKFLN